MRVFKGISVLLLAVALATCSDPTASPDDAKAAQFVRMTIDGMAWEATGANVSFTNRGAARFDFSAFRSQNSSLSVTVSGVQAPGTYPLGSFSSPIVLATVVTQVGSFGSLASTTVPFTAPGTITFSELSATRIAGTFDFRGTAGSSSAAPAGSTVSVTNGSFVILR